MEKKIFISSQLQITAEMDFQISRRNKTFCKMSLNMLKNLIEDITILLSEPNGRTQSTIIFLFCIYLSSINFEIMLEPKYYAITFLWRVNNGLHTETFPSLKNVLFFLISLLFHADVHNHNLHSQKLNRTVWVQGPDGFFYTSYHIPHSPNHSIFLYGSL